MLPAGHFAFEERVKVVTVFELGCMCVCALRGRVQHLDACTHAAAPVDPAAAAHLMYRYCRKQLDLDNSL